MLSPTLPLTDASTIKEKRDIEEPKGWLKKLQGLFTVDRDNLLKTCQGPFVSVTSDTAGTMLEGKNGVRYFIHSVFLTVSVAAATAASNVVVEYVKDGAYSVVLGIRTQTGAIQTVCGGSVVDILLPEGSPVVLADTAAPVTRVAVVTYCEVPV